MLRIIISIFIALIGGSILPLAFAPFGYYWIAIISLSILLLLWIYSTKKQAFLQGLAFGVGFFGFGVSWVYASIHTYGNANVLVAGLITGSMVLILSLYPALQGYFLNRVFPENNLQKILLAFPASWVVFEWIRSWFLSGFPWLILGTSQIDSPLKGFAPIIGASGVSFLVAFTAGLIVALVIRKKIWQRFLIIFIALCLWSSGYLLYKINWVHFSGKTFKVSLVQGNIPQEQKWDPKNLGKILGIYAKLTAPVLGNKIIVWPEGAIPVFPDEVSTFLKMMSNQARLHKTTILSGVPIIDKKNGRMFNGITAFGATKGTYLKRHLVPFGEYLPLKSVLSWLPNYLNIPMSGFSDGPKHQEPIIISGATIAPFVCYEIAFPYLVLSHFPRADLLVTVCDDSWFGKSIAAAQHVEIARVRSLETGRYQLLSTNTGITTIIDEKGKIIAIAPIFKESVLSSDIQIMRGKTPWVSFGHYFVLLIMLFLLWIAHKRSKTVTSL